MNINNFENHINGTILDRGYDYYTNGNVIETYSQGDNAYIFKVQGSGAYEVIVKLDDQGEIVTSHCDCPYDFGPICKHQVAVYYVLSDIMNDKQNKCVEMEEMPRHPSIKEILDTVSREELIKIIVAMAQKDETLENSLIVRYSKDDDTQELKKCKKLMESIVRKYQGREGFITYRETYGFTNEMEDILEKASDTDDVLLALDIAFLLLIEAIEAFQYADDSNGEIGQLVSETIDTIGEIVTDSTDLDSVLKGEIFDKLLKLSDDTVFDGWEDYRIDLLSLCVEFADVESLRNKLRQKIEDMMGENSGDAYKKYSDEAMLQILFEITDIHGTEEEAVEFIKQNLNYASFRELLIDKRTKEKNYQGVIELAMEGEKQDKQYAGLVSKWKKLRYEAYKQLSQKKEQQKLAKELLFDGNFEYYKELKELSTGNETALYNSLKQELKENKDRGWRGRSIYLQLIKQEKDLDEIMAFVRKNTESIEEYAGMLQEKFRDEVIDIYKEHIKAAASSAKNRRDYQGVCEMIKRYQKMAGKKNQETIINELTAFYKKRPAFVDELGKI